MIPYPQQVLQRIKKEQLRIRPPRVLLPIAIEIMSLIQKALLYSPNDHHNNYHDVGNLLYWVFKMQQIYSASS